MPAIPITPAQARKQCGQHFPDVVIEAFNELIAIHLDIQGQARIKQNDIVARIIEKFADSPKQVDAQTIMDKKWLDVELFFEQAGWEVRYEKPGFNESGESYFIFIARTR